MNEEQENSSASPDFDCTLHTHTHFLTCVPNDDVLEEIGVRHDAAVLLVWSKEAIDASSLDG
jgi:hypothetical protein